MFGPVAGVKDDVRDGWLSRFVEIAVQDVRYGFRSLRRNRGFALVIIVTMALGIGANTAIFSVVNGVLLRPLPYRDGDRLVVLHQGQGDPVANDIGFSAKDIADYREARSLSDVVEFHQMTFNLLGRAEPERLRTGVVSANYFDVLGVKALVGPDLRRSRRRGRGAGRAGAELQVLAAQLRRRCGRRRPGLSDERPSAHDHRRDAARAAVSERGRRLHADVRVPVPLESGQHRQQEFSPRAGVRAAQPRGEPVEGTGRSGAAERPAPAGVPGRTIRATGSAPWRCRSRTI